MSKRRPTPRRGSAGFALIAALAVLVILSSMGSLMIRLTQTQQAASSVALLGSRADSAAHGGIEWAIHEATTSGGCPSGTLNLSEGVLSGFTVVVSCASSLHREGTEVLTSLSIRSEARFGVLGSRDFVYRRVQASVVF